MRLMKLVAIEESKGESWDVRIFANKNADKVLVSENGHWCSDILDGDSYSFRGNAGSDLGSISIPLRSSESEGGDVAAYQTFILV